MTFSGHLTDRTEHLCGSEIGNQHSLGRESHEWLIVGYCTSIAMDRCRIVPHSFGRISNNTKNHTNVPDRYFDKTIMYCLSLSVCDTTQKKSSVRQTGNPTNRLTRGNFATNSLKAVINEIVYSVGEVKRCLWYFMRMQDCAPIYLIPDIISMERNIYKNLRYLMELRTWLRLPTWENIARNIKKILKAVLWSLQSPLKWFRMRHQGLKKISHDISSYSDQLAVLHSRMNYQLKKW